MYKIADATDSLTLYLRAAYIVAKSRGEGKRLNKRVTEVSLQLSEEAFKKKVLKLLSPSP